MKKPSLAFLRAQPIVWQPGRVMPRFAPERVPPGKIMVALENATPEVLQHGMIYADEMGVPIGVQRYIVDRQARSWVCAYFEAPEGTTHMRHFVTVKGSNRPVLLGSFSRDTRGEFR